jgi:hypothetical protein
MKKTLGTIAAAAVVVFALYTVLMALFINPVIDAVKNIVSG